ncbi:MAG: hypothetical protein NC204_03170 [Candidatus Amulumruptor caecigallinarius]|nr:hypothetical protein [Candidatus Amulumruptor caecigallinarius]
MKKITLIGAAVAALALASCSSDNENSQTRNYSLTAYNLYVPATGGGNVEFKEVVYNLTARTPENKLMISVDNMPVTGASVASFRTVEMPFTIGYSQIDGSSFQSVAASSANPTASGLAVKNLNMLWTQAFYAPPYAVAGYENWLTPGGMREFLVMQYNLSDMWNVRTFFPDLIFHGATTTEYGMGPYENSGTVYRIKMNLDNPVSSHYTADLIVYNAAFEKGADSATVILKNLDLSFSSSGIDVSGNNVNATMQSAGSSSSSTVMFDSFKAKILGDLTNVSINYRVDGRINGAFTGSCVKK